MTENDLETADNPFSLALRRLEDSEPVLLDLNRSLTGLAGEKLQAKVDEIPMPVMVYWKGGYKGDITLLTAGELVRNGAHWNGCEYANRRVVPWIETKCPCVEKTHRVDARAAAEYAKIGKDILAKLS